MKRRVLRLTAWPFGALLAWMSGMRGPCAGQILRVGGGDTHMLAAAGSIDVHLVILNGLLGDMWSRTLVRGA